MRTKALKPFDDKDNEPIWKLKLKEWWYDLPPVKWYYSLWVTYRRLKRVYRWSKFMWTNWDFDALSIYPLLEYKLKRVQYCLEQGHAIQEDKDMKALRIVIKLANRLANDYHETKLYDRHEAKWGQLHTWFTDCNDGTGCSQMHSKRPKAVTEEEQEKELEEFRNLFFALEPKWRGRDEKWFFEILRRHIRNLWD